MQPLRVYVDSSVFGGAFDQEFSVHTQAFFTQVRSGRFHLVISALVRYEIAGAPLPVQNLMQEMLVYSETVYPTYESLALQHAYLDSGILTQKWADDALHVAIASATQCDLIVSWNFKHIVHFEKVPRYNAVNVLQGYRQLAINTPAEVLRYED